MSIENWKKLILLLIRLAFFGLAESFNNGSAYLENVINEGIIG